MRPTLPTPVLAALSKQMTDRLRRRPSPTSVLKGVPLGGMTSEALTQWLIDRALTGMGPWDSAAALAARYQDTKRYGSVQAQVDALVRAESGKSFTTGFLTALPGALALPVALPAALVATWLLQARMVAAMAILQGHDTSDLWVRTTVLLALDDARTPEALREEGLDVGQWAALGMAQHIAQPLVQGLWKRAGEALVRRAMRRGWTRMGRAVPLLGAVVAGGLDAYGCQQVALRTRSLLIPADRLLEK
jgi:hypothetical protein